MNRNLNKDDYHSDPNHRFGRGVSVGIHLDPSEKLTIKRYMAQELMYYNSLTSGFGSRCRTFPETLLALHDDWIKVFAQLAYTGVSIAKLYKAKPDVELDSGLEPYRKFLVGKDATGKRFLTETMYSIMELATSKGIIHPLVRRNMAVSILRFYKEQAAKAIVKGSGDNVYRSAPEMLPVRDIAEKRHLQLPKSSLISIDWDDDEECTNVKHCYSEKILKIPNINLTQNNHWNMLILHQEVDTDVLPSSSWFVDIRKSDQPYMIKYIDNSSPKTGQAFAIAKRRSF